WMNSEWGQAIDAIERSAEITRERRTAVEVDAWRLALLGESHLGLGDGQRARRLVEEALQVAQARGQPLIETFASLALARVLLGYGKAARAEVEAALTRVLALTTGEGAKGFEPFVHAEFAELARQCGDEEKRERELREAHRLFTEIGASGHAERLSA